MRFRIARLTLAFATLAVLSACGDDIQFADPPEKKDPHAGHNHAPGAHPTGTTKIPTHGTDPGSATDENDPFKDADVEGQKPDSNAAEVVFSGTLTLPEGVTLPDPAFAWVSAGHPPRGRPPVLTKLHKDAKFPLAFELRRGDVAFPGAAVPAEADLVVYLSVGKNRFVEGIVTRFAPSDPKPMGSKDLALTLKKQ